MYKLPCDEELNIAINERFSDALDLLIGNPNNESFHDAEWLMDCVPDWCSKERAIEAYKELWDTVNGEKREVPDLLCEYINARAMEYYVDVLEDTLKEAESLGDNEAISDAKCDLLFSLSDAYKKKRYQEYLDEFDDESYEPEDEYYKDTFAVSHWKDYLWDIDYELLDMIDEKQLKGSVIDKMLGIY